jgi:hypothetical protein
MKNEADILREASRMVPLIRSITNEARDRKHSIRFLEAKIRKVALHRRDRVAQIRPLESQLFLQRRELESIHEELARLGCSMDARQPGRIVWHVAGSEVAFEDGLDKNMVRPQRGTIS